MKNYFCGWYIKCQNGHQTVALIPAYHISDGIKTCSLQVITDDASWNIPMGDLTIENSHVDTGANHFSPQGFSLDIDTPQLKAAGQIAFGPFSPIRYDIMGPFQYVPFMECRHSVFSMKHTVNGSLTINGTNYVFENGVGYIEGDRGTSFPRDYVWTQCCFPEGSVMLSVARIPFCGLHFTGVISVIHYQGKEYRLATYLGARVAYRHDGEVVIRQGNKELRVKRLEKKGHPLAAPVAGNMTRTIHETAACRTFYSYKENGKTIFEFESDQAAFEYEYPQ